MKEKKIAREARNKEKLANDDWVMAEFYATWCPHCKRMQPVVEEFKKLMEGTLEVVQIDVDQEDALAEFYTIEGTPTFILFRKGEQLWRQSGELSRERLERAVNEFKSRLFHLSFDLGVQSPYPCQCGMGGYPVVGNQCVTNMSNLNFSHF